MAEREREIEMFGLKREAGGRERERERLLNLWVFGKWSKRGAQFLSKSCVFEIDGSDTTAVNPLAFNFY